MEGRDRKREEGHELCKDPLNFLRKRGKKMSPEYLH